jgi:hypothetical protein
MESGLVGDAPLELDGADEAERRVTASGIAARVRNAVRQTSSLFSVLKNVSTNALSKQCPLPDIEITTPCLRSSA